MPNMGEVYGGEDDERTSRRLYLVMALALVLAGAVVFAAGATRVISRVLVAAGTPGPIADRAAVFCGALLPPALLAIALVALRADRGARLVAVAGVAFSTAGAVGFVAIPAEGWRFAGVALLYALGLLFGLASVARAVTGTLPVVDREVARLAAAPRPSVRRARGRLPADGGEEDDDIKPLLEE